MNMPRYETLHGFLVYSRPIGERSHLATLLTKEHCRLSVFFKQKLPELGRQFEVKVKRSSSQISAGEFRYTDPVLLQTASAKYFSLYINELTYRLAQIEVADLDFYAAYMRALLEVNYDEKVQPALREFEWSLLNNVGQAFDFLHDQTTHPIDPEAHYEFLAGQGFQVNPQGRYLGAQILAAGRLDNGVQGALATARECLFAQLNALLENQPLESREWLKSVATR